MIIQKKGITLIALILTIIILVIMAGITVNALVGDNGILGNVMNAKIRQEDEGAKEELQLAWSARMSKFYEDVAAGKVSYDDIGLYFNKNELNQMLGSSGGKITRITYDEENKSFEIRYTSNRRYQLYRNN
ncbi:MAG: hypothetical protein IJ867_02120 [Clostridia bacterium]|nr:hypothetical protein [Clostridia bacterium]